MNKPRCNTHTNSTTRPVACSTCLRIYVEQLIVRKLAHELLKAGYGLDVAQAGDPIDARNSTQNERTILSRLMETDEDYLRVFDGEKWFGWVRLVYGNDGPDVVNDYTTNLETVLKPVNEYADTLESGN